MTTRRQSCGKVMFLHLSVYSLGGGSVIPHRPETTPRGAKPPRKIWDQTGSDIIPPGKNMGPDRK